MAAEALAGLDADGHLRTTLRGGYVVRKLSDQEVYGALWLKWQLAGFGARALAREPNIAVNDALCVLTDWSPDPTALAPSEMEQFIQRSREVQKLILHRPAECGVLAPLRLLMSPALHRKVVHDMNCDDVMKAWRTTIEVVEFSSRGDAERARASCVARRSG